MFTFGRAHEKEVAARYVRDPAQVSTLDHLIDGIHDLLEGTGTLEDVTQALDQAFVSGGSGVWEQAGSWLVKLTSEFPEAAGRWAFYGRHRLANVRTRVAAHLTDVPPDMMLPLAQALLSDRSGRVRGMAAGALSGVSTPKVRLLLQEALAGEREPSVRASLEDALAEHEGG